jgi:hypothetical protein
MARAWRDLFHPSGRATRLVGYMSRAQALEAVGLQA